MTRLTRRQMEVLNDMHNAESVYAYGCDKWTPDMRYMLNGSEHCVHATIARHLIEKGFVVLGDKSLTRREVTIK